MIANKSTVPKHLKKLIQNLKKLKAFNFTVNFTEFTFGAFFLNIIVITNLLTFYV